MATCTLRVTFGTADQSATGNIMCASFADAAREAARCLEQRHEYRSPLLAVEILSGDYAPRLSNGTWVAAPDAGWRD